MNEKIFISSWISRISSDGIKIFPSDFLSEKIICNEITLPGKTLLIGEEFFGHYEIITADGDSVIRTDSYLKAKYILYANRNTPEKIFMPGNEDEVKRTVRSYELYLDSLIKEIETDYKKNFPGEKNSKTVVSEIFRQLNLVRV